MSSPETSHQNFDTNADQIVDQTGFDTDGNQRIDTWYLDDDQNGIADAYAFDLDGNGSADVWNLDANEDNVTDRTIDGSVASDPIAAEVTEDLSSWFEQGTTFTCGPAAATQIVEDFLGRDFVNEAELYAFANAQGWMTERGMAIEHLDDLLTHYGVPSHVEVAGYDPQTAFETVDGYIEQGRAVVLFVDASEYLTGTDADTYHFVRVVDVDMDRGVAILSDSAVGYGAGLEVPLATLAAAWDERPEGQASLSYHVVLTDVTDADGVGRSEAASPTHMVMAPGQPLALLPVTVTAAGVEQLRAG